MTIPSVRHKFHARPCEEDGIKFPSAKERDYYRQLLLAQRSGDLLFFLRQVPFHLNDGTRYVVDFAEFWKDGSVRFVEVKGYKTPIYKLKKRLIEAAFPIQIIEV